MLDKQTTGFVSYFMQAYSKRTGLLVGLLVLSGLAEGIGIATLLPMLELANRGGGGHSSKFTQGVADFLNVFGLAPQLGVLLSLIVFGMLLKGAFRLLAMKQIGYTVAHVTTDMRLDLIRALLRTRWAYFTSQPAGRFANSISSEATRAANAYRNACSMFATVVQVLVYAAIAYLVSPTIALFALLGGAGIVLVLSRLVQMSREAGRSQTTLMNSLISRLTDALQGIKPIKAMGREAHLRPLLENETHGLNATQERQVLASEAVSSAQEPLLVVMMALALYFALTVGNQSLATVLVMAFLFYRLAGRVSQLQIEYQGIASGESAFWSMRENIDLALEQRESTSGRLTPPPLEHEIALDCVSFAYGDAPVLDNISLSLPAGCFVAIVGPSGAGKTTIADLVVGLYEPQQGAVLIDGVPLRDINLNAWRQKIGYVPQEMFLFHDSVFQNVTLGDPDVSRDDVTRALKSAGAWDFVAQLPEGLDTVMGERGSRLSGGQRQRVAIARALVRKPRLLVLDEVTTALDPATEAAICDTLRELSGEVTILSISHQPAMMQVADLVYRLEGGRVQEKMVGTSRSLVAAAS